MGRVTFWPIPRAIDVEAHHYPRHWKRNMFFLYSGAFLIAFQVQRYGHMCRVSYPSFYNVYFIAIYHACWRVHGLGKSQRPQESQVPHPKLNVHLGNI